MFKLFVLATFVPFALSRDDEGCSNHNRDACPPGEPMGPDTQTSESPGTSADELTDGLADGVVSTLGANPGWDKDGVYPVPAQKGMTICKEHDMKGTCADQYTGITNSLSSSWNDKISSTHIKSYFRCKFYCNSNGGAYMGTWDGPKTINWIRSWDDCISSFACERLCNTKQVHCASTDYSACYSKTLLSCKTCKTGYKRNSKGYCVEDPECTAVSLVIEKVELDSETVGLPDEITLDSFTKHNCNSGTPLVTTLTTSETVSHTVDTTYSLSSSFSKTLGQSMSTSVTLTVKGEIVPGFGADASTKIDSSSSWSTTVDSSKTSTNKEVNETTYVWTQADQVTTAAYHNLTYTSIGRSIPGKIKWTGTMTCYNKLNNLQKTKAVSGTYSGAKIMSWDAEANAVACGAPAGFDLEMNVQCEDNMIDTGDVSYSTLMDAQSACQKLGKACLGVMDKDCDGLLDYYLCANNGKALAKSKAGTCVYKQKQETSSMQPAAVLATTPGGTYEGSKSILGMDIDATVTIGTSTLDMKISGAVSVNCKKEDYTYSNGDITVDDIDKDGDCIHDAMDSAGVSLESITYDSSSDTITVEVKKSIIKISLELTPQDSQLVAPMKVQAIRLE